MGTFLLQSGHQNLTQFAILSHLQLHACHISSFMLVTSPASCMSHLQLHACHISSFMHVTSPASCMSHLQLHACHISSFMLVTSPASCTPRCPLVHAVNNSHRRCNRALLPGTCCQQLTLEVQKRNAPGTCCHQLTMEVQQRNTCCQQLTGGATEGCPLVYVVNNSHWRCNRGMNTVNNSQWRCNRGMNLVNNSQWRCNRGMYVNN